MNHFPHAIAVAAGLERPGGTGPCGGAHFHCHTNFPVDAVRIDLDPSAVPDWNEIDAVRINL